MEYLTNLFKALSDETRLRILILLYHRKLCVCQLQGILEEVQPKISKHLGKLRDMGFVKDERKEQFIFYYLDSENELLKEVIIKAILNSNNISLINRDIERLEHADSFIQVTKEELGNKH